MTELRVPAMFMRGGTSKAIMFREGDLPARDEWDALFTGAMGTPDPYGRQLNGMGGGLSSLSKVCIVAPSERADADVDYTFGQVLIDEARVDYKGNCGNMSSAVGPFAIESGLINRAGDSATVRIHNTNTGKIIHSTFPVQDGLVLYEGDLAIPGVSGTGAPVALNFLSPGGATTGSLLPTGQIVDAFDLSFGKLDVSCIDAANACVFVAAAGLGLSATESPSELEEPILLGKLNEIRCLASVAMGIAPTVEGAASISTVPYVAVVGPAQDYRMLDGSIVSANAHDIAIRVISNGQPHRASPLTIALCAAVAARIEGSIFARVMPSDTAAGARPVRLGTPSGVLTVDAEVRKMPGGLWEAVSGSFFRTARVLFEGHVRSRIDG
jgi:2-methylaconitate cis-trans-isomerase PrpF